MNSHLRGLNAISLLNSQFLKFASLFSSTRERRGNLSVNVWSAVILLVTQITHSQKYEHAVHKNIEE